MKEPLLHVLVINWNGREHLRDCFDSLLACPYTNARFVLVDNGSTGSITAMIPGLTFLNSRKISAGAAATMRECSGRWKPA
jgi:hypothetical protein